MTTENERGGEGRGLIKDSATSFATSPAPEQKTQQGI
jgi:hypothetical protein